MKIFYAVSLIAMIGLGSCTKEPVKSTETPVESAALLSRVFMYTDPISKDSVGYTTVRDSVRTTTTANATGQLSILIDMPFNKGKDYVQFTIDKAKIKPGYTGTYELKPAQTSGLQGDAQTVYGYRRDQYSYTELGAGNAEGVLTITGYDAQKKLIAGSYRFTIHSFHDPKVGMNWHETNIIVDGVFEKVLLP
jgi:hypothetical protein